MKEISRRIAILKSDIKDYSKIEKNHLYTSVTKFNTDFEKKFLNENNHFYCKTAGDSFLICSYEPADLAEMALELRDRFINTNWTKSGFPFELKVRIGIHFGQASLIEEQAKISEVSGQSIIIAARIEPNVALNQIYCSESFYDSLKSETNLKFKFISLGTQKLAKNFGEMKLYKVLRDYESDISSEKSNIVDLET